MHPAKPDTHLKDAEGHPAEAEACASGPRASLGVRVIGGTLKIGLAQALFPLSGLITAGVLTRYLGAEGYGHFTLTAALVAWVELSIAALLGNATVHWVAKADHRSAAIRAILRLHLVLGVATAALFWLLADPLAALWRMPEIASTLRLFSLDIPIFLLARGCGSVLAGKQAFSQQAVAMAGRWTARLGLTVLLVVLGFSIRGAVLAALGASLIELLIASRRLPRPALFRSPAPLPGLWSLAGPLFVSAVAIRVLHLDLMFLKALGASAAEAGYYAAAHNLTLAPILIAAAAGGPLLATLTRAVEAGEREEARRVTDVMTRLLFASLPCVAVISGSAGAIVSLIYGARFAEAGALLSVLIFSAAGILAVSLGATPVIALGRPRLTLIPVLPVVPAALLAYVVVVPRLGPIGAAAVTSIAAAAAGLISVAVSLRCWELPTPVFSILRSAVLAGVFYWWSDRWDLQGPWVIAKLAALGALVPVAYALLGEFSERDREELRGLLPRAAQG